MNYGVALYEGAFDYPNLGPAIDRWMEQAEAKPHVVPVWVRMGQPFPSVAIDALRERGIKPVIFLEAESVPTVAECHALGSRLDALTEDVGHIICRFDQEANGRSLPGPTWRWRDLTPSEYKQEFRLVSREVRSIAPKVRFAYCPIVRGPRRQQEIVAYYPGEQAAQVVGTDIYARRNPSLMLPAKSDPTLSTLRRLDPTASAWLFEFGVQRGLGGKFRREWLRSVTRSDFDGAIYFDIRPPGENVDWRMTKRMRRFYGRMF